jgi:hypothetical protein
MAVAAVAVAVAAGSVLLGASVSLVAPAGSRLGADGGGTHPVVFDGGSCQAVIEAHAEEGFTHVACAPAPTYRTAPPSSGNHYPVWADFHSYDAPVPWGHLVHDLEHGAVVIVYNCPGGCPDEVAAAQAFIDALPSDPLCTAPDVRRVILAPDPTLDVRWGASAWTWTLRADCFLADAFTAFLRDHYDHGREALCGEVHPTFCAPG